MLLYDVDCCMSDRGIKIVECCCSQLFHHCLLALWQIHSHLIFHALPFGDLYHPLPSLPSWVPRQSCPGATYRESISLGAVPHSAEAAITCIHLLQPDFPIVSTCSLTVCLSPGFRSVFVLVLVVEGSVADPAEVGSAMASHCLPPAETLLI